MADDTTLSAYPIAFFNICKVIPSPIEKNAISRSIKGQLVVTALMDPFC
ncbi:hypothetical protein [Rhodovulum sp. MB263]